MGDSQSKQFGNRYLDKLGTQLDKSAPVFGESLFAGPSSNTQHAWNYGSAVANNLVNSGGFGIGQQDAVNGLGRVGQGYAGLAGAYDPNSAAYRTLRSELSDDVLTGAASLGASNGRYGAKSFYEGASEGLGNALAGLDYTNMQRNVDNQYRSLDSQAGVQSALFDAGQTALTNRNDAVDRLTGIGSAIDANAQGALLGRADLYDRTKNAELDRLIKIGAAFGDPVGAANEAPWWQQGLGALLGFGGSAISGGALR
jgi:hypothetical protein